MSPLFKKNNSQSEIAVVYDIGSASVGASLVELRPNKNPKILYSVRKTAAFLRRGDTERLLGAVGKSLNEVSLDIQKDGLKHLKFTKRGGQTIDSAYCFFSSPWYVSHTTTLHY